MKVQCTLPSFLQYSISICLSVRAARASRMCCAACCEVRGPCKNSAVAGRRMSSALEKPTNSQKPSLQQMIGYDSTCAFASRKRRSAKKTKTKHIKNCKYFNIQYTTNFFKFTYEALYKIITLSYKLYFYAEGRYGASKITIKNIS